MQERYSVYDAKTKLSEILRTVRKSRQVIITDRGRDVARVVPIEPGGGLARRLKALEESGVLVASDSAKPSAISPIARRPGALRRFLASRSRY